MPGSLVLWARASGRWPVGVRHLIGVAGLLAACVAGAQSVPRSASAPAAAPAAAAPAPNVFQFPVYRNAAEIDAACARLLKDARAQAERLQASPASEAPGLIGELDEMTRRYEDTLGPLSVIAAVHPAKPLRDAAERCELQYQQFSAAFSQNAAVHAQLKRVQASDDIDRRFVQDQLDVFEDAGVALNADDQARAQGLNEKITRLTQDFERQLREARVRLAFTRDELQGVPPATWRRAPRDAKGRYLIDLNGPNFEAVADNAVQAPVRERIWRAYISQGGDANLRRLDEIARLRRSYAQLLGFASHDDLALRRRMAHDEATAQRFLASVKTAVAERELADLAVLRAEKAEHLGQADVKLERWDIGFYAERVRRKRHAVNQDEFRAYFPPEASLDFVFRVAQKMFGVRFQRQPMALWHADARAYAVTDLASGHALGTLFVDLYPRADKYNHAAVWSFRSVSTRVHRLPAAALVVNFNRQGLSLGELETLLHEFGHALHSLLSSTRYASQGGTNTQLDFVEAPSQMLEDWVYDPQVMKVFQEVCSSCQPVPPEMLQRAYRARDFGKGLQMARQHLFGRYDLALYGPTEHNAMQLWKAMETDTPLGHVPGTKFPAGFAHIAGGYAAGYYSYLWSLALAEDLRTVFAGDKLSPEIGQRYRETVLSQGGQIDPREMMRRFLGRDTNTDAFFKALQRQ